MHCSRKGVFIVGNSESKVPLWEKYILTIQEAAEYFHIGEKKLRRLVEERADADFIIMNGNRAMIKRKLFEKYLDESASV
ncbi:MAG: helix-turn-helix domain-containing protein [Lachnospiraceae bacterium]|nr:helix-turn-helix domain-containing protein [Lachnospiraceae bacterium]